MKNLVEYIVKAIVESPDAVNVEETVLPDGKIILTIHTAPSDVGLVIGKMGKTINSIRSLVKIKAIKEGKFVDVKVPSDRDNGSNGGSASGYTNTQQAPVPSVSAVADTTAVTGVFDEPNF